MLPVIKHHHIITSLLLFSSSHSLPSAFQRYFVLFVTAAVGFLATPSAAFELELLNHEDLGVRERELYSFGKFCSPSIGSFAETKATFVNGDSITWTLGKCCCLEATECVPTGREGNANPDYRAGTELSVTGSTDDPLCFILDMFLQNCVLRKRQPLLPWKPLWGASLKLASTLR